MLHKSATTLAVFLSLSLLGPFTAEAGTISYLPITGDADSGIDAANFYTHAVDFGNGSPGAVVNTVPFARVTTGDLPREVAYKATTGTLDSHGGNASHNVTGSMADLLTDMVYNGNNAAEGRATVTVTGLVPGCQYDARIYTRQWGTGTRTSIVGFDANADGNADDSITLSQDDATANPPGFTAANQAYALSYQFTAASDHLDISFDQQAANWSWHVYGMSNQITDGPAATLANPNFEADSFSTSPGYVDKNQAISGWKASDAKRVGLNDVAGPFVNGQTIPEGSNVALLQQNNTPTATLSQRLFGLEVGKNYTIQYKESERTAAQATKGFVTLDGQSVVPVHDVQRKDRFVRTVSDPFTATAATMDLVIGNEGGVDRGDNTLLIDDIQFTRAVPRVPNGGFEEPVFAGAGWDYTPAGSVWTMTNAGIAANGSPWVNNGSTLEGRQAGFMQGATGVIEQTIDNFEQGVTYRLSWDENLRTGQGGANPYRVLLDGVQIFATDASGVSNGWTTRSAEYVPHAAGSAVLRLESIYATEGVTGDRSSLFDDIHFTFVTESSGQVPIDPTSLGLFATGIDAGSDGIDDNYTLASVPGGGAGTANITAHPAWQADTADSKWLSPATSGATNVAIGQYIWETTFDTTDVDFTTLSINGQFAADDKLLDVLLNGESQGIYGGGFNRWTTFQFNSDFLDGLNTIQFLVSNGGAGANPSGFRVEYLDAMAVTTTAAVPEPSSLMLLVLGGLIALGMRSRRPAMQPKKQR